MPASDAAELYLAPPDRGGSDANPGTKDKPFATLERARDEVRTLKKKGLPKGGVIVWLHEGTYELARTFALGREDSGTAEEPIVYRALPGAQARLCGGRTLPASAFRPVTDEVVLARMDAAAREKVLAADLKALGIAEFGKMEVRGFGHGLVPSGLELFFNRRAVGVV